MKLKSTPDKKSANLPKGYRILLFVLPIFLFITTSIKTNAQATCVGIIDSTKTEFCIGNGSITFSNAIATGEHVEWLSSGDGTFSDKFAQKPTYTPGPLDSANGYVFIYLDVFKDDTVNFCSALPLVTLHLSKMATTASPASQTACANVGISNISFASALSTTTYAWVRDNPNVGGTITTSGTATNIAPIKGTLVNNTANPVLVTFTVTPKAATCDGTPIKATVLVNPKPTATPTPASQTVCSGSTITPIVFTGQANNTVYNWTRNKSDSVTGIAASGSGNISGVLTNNNTVPVTVTFTITPTAYGCNGAAVTATITVNPSSTAVISTTPATQTICSGTTITNIISSGGTGGTVYNWTRNNTTQATGIAASGSGNITGTLTNTTSAPVYVTFTVTPSTGTCANRATVIVNPKPVAVAAPLTQTVCSGSGISTIALTSAVSGTVLSWTRNNTASVTGIAASGTGDISGILTNTTSAPVTVTFTITPTANGCAGNPITATVTVNPRPTSVISGNYAVCANTQAPNINLAFTGTGPWNFTYSDGTTPVTVTGYASSAYSFPAPVQPCTFTVTALSDALCAAQPGDMTGSAVLTLNTYKILASSGANGVVTPADSSFVNCGSNKTYTITPNGGYAIQDVLVDGVSVGAVATYTFTNVTAPHTISAAFTAVASSFNITATPGSNGTISPSGTTSVASGGTQAFTITPNAGYAIQDVLVDGVSVGAVTTYTFTNVTAPHTISATFSVVTYTISASAGTNGTISPAGATAVNSGAAQSYTITPNSCYQVADVLVDGVSVGAVTSYSFTNVTAPHTISASFTTLSYSITASADANGSITPTGATSVACGGTQAYSITANSGFAVQDVLVDGVSQGAITSYSFTNVTAPHTISVSFTVAVSCTAPTLSTIVTNVLCKGSSTGSVSVTTTGGTAPFSYAWTGPNGYTATTKDISNLTAGTYTLTVTATGGCTTGTSVTITEPASAITATASAGTIVCAGGTTTLTVVASGGTGALQYSLNNGTFQSSNTFTVTSAGSPYTVTVRDANLCTVNSNTVTVANGASAPAQPTSVTGATYGLCGGGTFTYTVTPVAGATSYTWVVPTGFTITSGQNTGQITVTVPSSFTTSGTIGVTPKNACGTGTQYRFTVFAILYYPGTSIVGPSSVTPNQANVQYSLPSVAGATYNWLATSGATITAGQGTSTITVKFGTANSNISVDIVNACGTAPRATKSVTVAAGRQAVTSRKEAATDEIATAPALSIYPNPAKNTATVSFGSTKSGDKYEVVVISAVGGTLQSKSGKTMAGTNTIQLDLANYSSGIYFVRLLTDGKMSTQKLIKEK